MNITEMKFYNDHNNIRVDKAAPGSFDWAIFTRDGQLIEKSESGKNDWWKGWTEQELQEVSEKIRHFPSAPYSGDVYLRFNRPPKSGKSRNYATGELEKGVSCYALRWDLVAGCYKRTGGGLDGAMFAYMIQGAPIYLITGNECGIGSDGEPLLDNVKVLARMKRDREKDGWSVDPTKKVKQKAREPEGPVL